MAIFTNTLISGLVASIFVINAPLTASETGKREAEVVIEQSDVTRSFVVKAKQGNPVNVVVDEDGQQYTFKLSKEELADLDLLNNKLVGLNQETLEKVREALQSVNESMIKFNTSGIDGGIVIKLDDDGIMSDVDLGELEGLEALEKLEALEGLESLGDLDQLKELAELGKLKDLKIKVIDKLMTKEHAHAIRERAREMSEHEREMAHHEREMSKHARDMERKHRMIIVDGESADIMFNVDDEVGDVQVRKFKLGEDNMVLKGHVDAILKLIAHGEFSQEELDKLQQLLDSKR